MVNFNTVTPFLLLEMACDFKFIGIKCNITSSGVIY